MPAASIVSLLYIVVICTVGGVFGSRSVHLDCAQHDRNVEARLDAYSSPDLLVLERCTLEDIGESLFYILFLSGQ